MTDAASIRLAVQGATGLKYLLWQELHHSAKSVAGGGAEVALALPALPDEAEEEERVVLALLALPDGIGEEEGALPEVPGGVVVFSGFGFGG